jgi:hypothetical protein
MTDELKQELVSANSRLEAAQSYLQDDTEFSSFKSMQTHYSDSEMGQINVLELKTEKQRVFSLSSIFTPVSYQH